MYFDLNKLERSAPRFKASRSGVFNRPFYKALVKKVPSIKHLTTKQIKKIITECHEKFQDLIVNNRDGAVLPEQMGHCFIGSCERPRKKINPDMVTSTKYKVTVSHRNWTTDEHICKIFYTNYGSKYKFKNSAYWGFRACRKLKRKSHLKYIVDWNMYLKVAPFARISRIIRLKLKE